MLVFLPPAVEDLGWLLLSGLCHLFFLIFSRENHSSINLRFLQSATLGAFPEFPSQCIGRGIRVSVLISLSRGLGGASDTKSNWFPPRVNQMRLLLYLGI